MAKRKTKSEVEVENTLNERVNKDTKEIKDQKENKERVVYKRRLRRL